MLIFMFNSYSKLEAKTNANVSSTKRNSNKVSSFTMQPVISLFANGVILQFFLLILTIASNSTVFVCQQQS